MNAEDVARYLREHPDFLNEHHELFTELTVPHPQHGGQAISLAERQLHALRDKIRALEVKLAELIRFGEENDDISAKVHRLAVALLLAGSQASVRAALVDGLRDDFAVPHVSLKLWGAVAEAVGEGSPWATWRSARRCAGRSMPCATLIAVRPKAWRWRAGSARLLPTFARWR